MGHLTTTPARGKEVFAFEYDKEWLRSYVGSAPSRAVGMVTTPS